MRSMIILAAVILAGLGVSIFRVHVTTTARRLEGAASPGRLSAAHAFLKDKCSMCHTPNTGVEAANCIVCHANNETLLQRQSTVFHASLGTCADCHLEHQGASVRPTAMDHTALARIALSMLKHSAPDTENAAVARRIRSWVRSSGEATSLALSLNCFACHATRDPHLGFFGRDCQDCHLTEQWTIAGYRHPTARSRDCGQCHQAPPSHYMEHFRMVSMKVAGVENAKVSECYRCHKITSWNDIVGVGFYKHH